MNGRSESVLREGYDYSFSRLDPATGAHVDPPWCAIYETATYLSSDGTLEPFVAASWSAEREGRRLRITVHPRTFHSGAVCDARAVAAAFRLHSDPVESHVNSFFWEAVEGVTVEGHVFRPAPVAWHEGMRITDAIGSVDELRPNADINYVLIRRELPPDRRVELLSADLAAALREPASRKNVTLMPRDRIIVFDSTAGRQQLLEPILEEIRRQSRIDMPSEIVRIAGRVKASVIATLPPMLCPTSVAGPAPAASIRRATSAAIAA